MYLLYEHLKDEHGNILATDMLLSSFYPGTTGVRWKDPTESGIFEICKLTFKSIPIKERTYNPDTTIWSFMGGAGKRVYDSLKANPVASAGLKFQKIDGLEDQKRAGRISAPVKSLFDAADFFYEPAAPVSTAPPRDKIIEELGNMLELQPKTAILVMDAAELKRRYRQAALKYHPDRNNGDGSKMSDLNYWWQQWQPFASI